MAVLLMYLEVVMALYDNHTCGAYVWCICVFVLLPTQTCDQHARLDVMDPILQQDSGRSDPQPSTGLLPRCMLGVLGLPSN